MKKITALLLALMMLAGILAGCGKPKDTGKAGKLKVVTTIFPAYDWVRAILGDKADNAEITMLLDNGVDLHSYQPTADDIVKIWTPSLPAAPNCKTGYAVLHLPKRKCCGEKRRA